MENYIEEIKKLMDDYKILKNKILDILMKSNTGTMLDFAITGDIFFEISKSILLTDKENLFKSRAMVREFINNIIIKDLKEEFGQTLFDEEADNKLYGDKNV